MKRLDRILAVLDPTAEAQPALGKAATLARRFGATLELFICDFDPALSGKPFFDTDKLRRLREEFVGERLESPAQFDRCHAREPAQQCGAR